MRFIDYRRVTDEDILNLEDEAPSGHAGDGQPVDHWITKDHRHIPIVAQGHGGSEKSGKTYSGDATYYDLPGRKTASGQPFDANRIAAAMTSEKVKLGQTGSVSYSFRGDRGKTVTKTISVLVNDRGPFERNPNGTPKRPIRPDPHGVIDLTPAAFTELVGTLAVGRVHVTVTVPHEQKPDSHTRHP